MAGSGLQVLVLFSFKGGEVCLGLVAVVIPFLMTPPSHITVSSTCLSLEPHAWASWVWPFILSSSIFFFSWPQAHATTMDPSFPFSLAGCLRNQKVFETVYPPICSTLWSEILFI